jgi:hypothetical protein
MTRLSCSLALTVTLALLPGAAQANPATLAVLRTVAVVNDAGVAESMVQPAEPGTTKVTVVVSNEPRRAAAPVVAPEAVPAAAPTPPPQLVDYPRSPYADRIYKDRKSAPNLVAAGLAVGTLSYVFSTLAGALVIDRSRRITDDPLTETDEARVRRDRRAYGRALLVPGIGPAVAIARADTAMRAWGAGMAGLTQAIGVGLVIVGAHRLARARRLERLSFSAMGTAQEAHVAVRVRF